MDARPLLEARHEFMSNEGAHKLAQKYTEIQALNQIAVQARKMVFRADTEVTKKPDVKAKFEAFTEKKSLAETKNNGVPNQDLPADSELSRSRDEVWQYIKKNHDYFIRIIDRLRPRASLPNANDVPVKFSDIPEVQNTIVDQVTDYVARKGGLPTVGEAQEIPALRGILSTIVRDSEEFAQLKELPEKLQEGDPNQIIQLESNKTELAYKVARLEKDQAAFDMRGWRREAAKRSTKGVKVFETPYYKSIFGRCDIVQDKQNGIGGKVFFGPPGTGKTELALYDAEERNGYKSRVVSMHYWSSFNSLVYEASVKVAGNGAEHLNYQERMLKGVQLFEGMSEDDFSSTVDQMVVNLKAQGKVGQDTTSEEFLRPFSSAIPSVSAGKNRTARENVIAGLKQHAAAATFGHIMSEEDYWGEIVKGELLLAIDNGQNRIILDEGEKAGPYAWAGLSRILAMSPGQEIDVRGRKITIPSNVRFDVTVNSLQLDEFIKSRFNEIYVGYPPPKDEMMIASVWMSDAEGNILLSNDDQARVAGFFVYMLPEIRSLYEQHIIGQPFDLRVTRELCNMLVDPTTKKRNSISVERAIEMVLFEQRSFLQIPEEQSVLGAKEEIDRRRRDKEREAYEKLIGITSRYREMIESPPRYANDGDEADRRLHDRQQLMKSGNKDALHTVRRDVLSEGLQATIFSPLVQACNGLPDNIPVRRKPGENILTSENHLKRVSLDDKTRHKITSRLGQQEMSTRSDLEQNGTFETDIGFEIHLARDGSTVEFLTVPHNGNAESGQQLLSALLPNGLQIENIIDASPEGKYILARTSKAQGNELVMIDCLHPKGPSVLKLDSAGGDTRLLSDGLGVVSYSSERKSLSVKLVDQRNLALLDNNEFLFGDRQIDGYELSPDGCALLVKTGGETWYIDIQQMISRGASRPVQATERLRGTNWSLVGNEVIYQQGSTDCFLISAQSELRGKEQII